MKRIAAIALMAGASVLGCKRTDRDGFDRPGDPEPIWSATATSVLEGGKVTLTLSRGSERDDAQEMELASSDATRATVPATVTFPEGATSIPVTITTIADADNVDSLVTITATAGPKEDAVQVTLVEDDTGIGSAVGPVVFGTGTVLLLRPGADDLFGTSDDVLSVVENLGSTTTDPATTDVVIGAVTPGPHALPVVTGVSGGVLVLTNGPDLTLGTTDDTLVEVGSIATTPAVVDTIVVGRMESSEARRPIVVGTRAVIAHRGADLLTNGDDGLAIVDGLGTGSLTLTSFAVPGIAFEGPSIPVAVDATSLTMVTSGPDFVFSSGDEELRVVTGLGGAVATSVLLVLDINGSRIGNAVRVNATTVAVVDEGPDNTAGNADDEMYSVIDVFTAPASFISLVGPVSLDPQAIPVASGSDEVLVPTVGPDLVPGNADDGVAVVNQFAIGSVSFSFTTGGLFGGSAVRPVFLSPTIAAVLSRGADNLEGTADDVIAVITGADFAPSVSTVATGALQPASPLPTSATSLALVGEGADASPGTADDRTLEITALGGAPVTNLNLTGSFYLSGDPVLVTTGGEPIVVARTRGDDDAPSTSDDTLSVAVIP